MTKQELINYITDRVDTNNSFGVSAKDVQEAIVQVVNELYDTAFSGASSLQEVLEIGNTADTDTIQGIILQSVVDGVTNTLNSSGLSVSQTGSESIALVVSKDVPYAYQKTLSDGSNFTKTFNGFQENYQTTDNGDLGFSCSYQESYAPSGDFKTISANGGQLGYQRSFNPQEVRFLGNSIGSNSQDTFEFTARNNFFNISGSECGNYYEFRYDQNSSRFSLNKDINGFNPSATLGVNGNIQAALIEEETSTPEYALVPDSDGIIKKYPFPVKETEFGSFRLDGGSVLELDKLYSSVYVEFTSSGDVTIKLPNPLTEEHIGDWFFLNNNSGLSQGSRITVISEDGNGLYNSGLIPADGSLTLKIVRLRTAPQTNAFISKFVEIQKDTI